MLSVRIKTENPKATDLLVQKLHEKFPYIDIAQGAEVLLDFDEAYIAAREYFAYYFVMTTDEVVNYVNSNKIGVTWQFITDAIFNDGINAIWRFFDSTAKDHGDILSRNKTIFGFSISKLNVDDDYGKRIKCHRHNRVAHFGNGYFNKISDIKYDDPIVVLNQLRIDMRNFKRGYFDLEDTTYDNLKIYFCEKIPSISKLLNNEVNSNKIKEQIESYLSSVIGE